MTSAAPESVRLEMPDRSADARSAPSPILTNGISAKLRETHLEQGDGRLTSRDAGRYLAAEAAASGHGSRHRRAVRQGGGRGASTASGISILSRSRLDRRMARVPSPLALAGARCIII